MSYLVLARKYRPADFTQVSGQEHVTRTLKNSILRNKVAHAILLSGPRGVGKTSIARIFSKALNCEKGPTPDPCLKCTNCREIAQGTSLAVREIDGASHNSVDNVRELIESFRSLPAPGYRYKIYIIDEVHMLSLAAFNALLKSLEEPPPNTVFILATTEAHRIPETVISRCQRHDLRALNAQEIEEQLKKVVASEKIKAEPGVIRMIARLADGSMRDAQSLLDRIQSFCDGDINVQDAGQVLGVVHRGVLFSISEAIVKRDAQKALAITLEAFSSGLDVSIFLKEFVAHWREMLLVKYAPEDSLTSIGVPADDRIELKRQAEGLADQTLRALVNLARQGADSALRSSHPKYALEALIVQMSVLDAQAEAPASRAQQPRSGGAITSGSVSTERVQGHTSQGAVPQGNLAPARQQSTAAPIKLEKASPISEVKKHPSAASLDWWSFVKQLTAGKSKMLSEYVKRLAVAHFSLGALEAVGPEFTIKALKQGEYHDRLVAALSEAFNHKNWKLELGIQDGAGTGPVSVAEHEKQEAVQSVADRKKSILEHPQLKQLQKVFPGSAIEDIKVRE